MYIRKLILLTLSSLAFCFSPSLIAAADEMQMQAEAVQTHEVNINTADAKSLAKHLKGVGMKRATAIISYRETNGKFYSAEELMSVRGVGKHIFKMNEGRILVE